MQFESTTQAGLTIAGICIVCWLMVRSKLGRRKIQREVSAANLRFNGNASQPSETFSGTKSLGAPADALRWQVELHDLGRELKGELDCKMLAVNKLTRSYDQAANRLGALIRLSEQVANQPDTIFSKAQQLARAGWSEDRIAESLGIAADDVQLLLAPTPVAN